ncbi:MAG: hypothetical protein QOK40_1032 [Miltoncostaeaceae bacterium]|jgi:uncharacterized membrane protein|nr:hypothetical protein [Miltoncostaeaceae bacterium]
MISRLLAPLRRRRGQLDRPRRTLRMSAAHYDPEAFGRFSEGVARVIGTARFLVIQTGIVILWVIVNIIAWYLQFDPYPFIFLTLALSLQAAYAAPLILLAQTRQAERDRVQSERDRATADRTQAEAEFLAREVAAVRLAVGRLGQDVHDVEEALDDVRESLARIEAALGASRDAERAAETA